MTTAAPRQLPLDLAHVERLSRDDLLVTASNAEAVALLDRWPEWPSPVVVMAGPPGSGKSHISAVWQAEAGAAHLDAADLDRASEVGGPVVIDGIGDGPFDQKGLFHLINAVRDAGTNLLLTTRRFPLAWGVDLPDLASRLKAATTVEIREPDDALLAGVIMKLFSDRQVEVEPPAVHFLVRRMERSLESARRLVDRLDRAALERKTRISRAFAAQVLAEIEKEGAGTDRDD